MSTKKTFESFMNSTTPINENVDLYKTYKRISGKYSLRKPSYWGDLFNQRAAIPTRELNKYAAELDSLDVYTSRELGVDPEYPMQSNFKVQVPQVFVMYCNTERGELSDYYGMSILVNTEGATYPRYAAGMPDFEPELHNFVNGVPESYLNIIVTGAQLLNEKLIAEGQFSWMTQDTGDQIGSEPQNKIDVYMYDNQGNSWKERDYEGYGEFGGMDYYDLVATMNGYSEEDVDGKKFKELRSIGIDLAFDKIKTRDKKRKTLFPALVTDPRYNWKRHDFTQEAESDPNQSWYQEPEYDDYEDDYGWDEEYESKKTNENQSLNEWGSSDQTYFLMSIHKDAGKPKKMPSPFDKRLRTAAESAVDFYWDEWPEYQTNREGLIDDAVRSYLRRYFKEDFAMMQRMFEPMESKQISEAEVLLFDELNDKFDSLATGISELMDKTEDPKWSKALGSLMNQLEKLISTAAKHDVKLGAIETNESVVNEKDDVSTHLDKFEEIVGNARDFFAIGKELDKGGYKKKYFYSDTMAPSYTIEVGGHRFAIINKKYVDKGDREVGDIAIGLLESSINERSINKIQKDYSKVVNDMADKVKSWKSCKESGDSKGEAKCLADLKALTAKKKELEKELDDAVAGKNKDAKLVITEARSWGTFGEFGDKKAVNKVTKTLDRALAKFETAITKAHADYQKAIKEFSTGASSEIGNKSGFNDSEGRASVHHYTMAVIKKAFGMEEWGGSLDYRVGWMYESNQIDEATDHNDPVLMKMRAAKMRADDMKKLDALKKKEEKERKKAMKRWNQKKYDKWLEDVASNDGWKNAFDMAQNAKYEPGLIDWVEKEFPGDDALQRIQWDIEAFAESVTNEGKIQLKRRYTENYPEITARSAARVRNAMIEALADGVLTEEEFNAILKEKSIDSKRWMRRNSKFFLVSEDGVSLSKWGQRVLKGIKSPKTTVDLTFESFRNKNLSK